MTTVTSASGTTTATAATSASKGTTASDASDRFLKLLVTQMQNQDPLNPMDNAQVTSQMAQINTVTGIDKLNTTMGTMNTTMAQMQMLQGAALVGHEVLLEGNQLALDDKGNASGGYELSSSAANVRIDIVNAAGTVVGSIDQTNKSSGRQAFTWTPPAGSSAAGLSFQVKATNGTKAVSSTPLMTDVVSAVNTNSGTLNLELSSGKSVPYGSVKAIS